MLASKTRRPNASALHCTCAPRRPGLACFCPAMPQASCLTLLEPHVSAIQLETRGEQFRPFSTMRRLRCDAPWSTVVPPTLRFQRGLAATDMLYSTKHFRPLQMKKRLRVTLQFNQVLSLHMYVQTPLGAVGGRSMERRKGPRISLDRPLTPTHREHHPIHHCPPAFCLVRGYPTERHERTMLCLCINGRLGSRCEMSGRASRSRRRRSRRPLPPPAKISGNPREPIMSGHEKQHCQRAGAAWGSSM